MFSFFFLSILLNRVFSFSWPGDPEQKGSVVGLMIKNWTMQRGIQEICILCIIGHDDDSRFRADTFNINCTSY